MSRQKSHWMPVRVATRSLEYLLNSLPFSIITYSCDIIYPLNYSHNSAADSDKGLIDDVASICRSETRRLAQYIGSHLHAAGRSSQ
ncbi:hypothetical protein NEOLEDRAFT_1126407 [Neolentinus lepideus HHB14362 ss-1]|uniref:Uncharacterized protein n=1 Tax=Neolentinus lepideus HHB14362 ss-1 TaxID=1314782 RepID=A0A165W7L0_9AGAM|nr:hypothetical protein NEOLEDRAFT_1126407 [Neolentinus lepideus HHB14362 ss-1]